MGAQNTATIDFGAFPGSAEASVAVTGQGSILSGSLAEAWLFPAATADHSVDEHYMASTMIDVIAGDVVAGVGFTVRAFVRDMNFAMSHAGELRYSAPDATGAQNTRYMAIGEKSVGGEAHRLTGQWTVGWVWN
jgi:hypothetical protein